jgi:hypothetical protein
MRTMQFPNPEQNIIIIIILNADPDLGSMRTMQFPNTEQNIIIIIIMIIITNTEKNV